MLASSVMRRLLLTAVLAVISLTAWAENIPEPGSLISLRVKSADFSSQDRTLDVQMQVEITDGWHINAHEPSFPYLVPTTLEVLPPDHFSLTNVNYPEPQSFAFAFANGETLKVYSGTIHLGISLDAGSSFGSEGVEFLSILRFQACNDEQCLPPAMIKRKFVVKSSDGQVADGVPSSAPETSGGTAVEQWITDYGLLPTLGLLVFMGLGLNLTPCVYPLVSVTLAYFGGQSDRSRSGTFLLALAYALGIAITFSVLGMTAALSGGLFGSALQNPLTLVAVAGLLTVLALSNFGLYTLQPPTYLMQKIGGAGIGISGALFMGLTMGIVAAPCVGPIVVGLLVAVGAIGDPILGLVLFFALAVGLGLPYVALATFAGGISKLPRSGEWLIWIEHLFGFVLLGMALWFISPLLPQEILRWIAPLFIAGSGLMLGFFDPTGEQSPRFVQAKRGLAILSLAAAAWIALPSGPEPESIPWQPLSGEALAEAQTRGIPAVIDFRADWCLPCLEMEHTTFADPKVHEATADFIMLEADVTAMSEENNLLLSDYKILGVPTTIFYDIYGNERHRVVGYINSNEFLRLLAETQSDGP